MTNPERKLFVIRRDKQPLLEHLEENCQPLYGSDVFFDDEGNIFYCVWYPAERAKVKPETYRRLSHRRESEESYLARPLTSMTHHELRVNRIQKDHGSVEAAIRSIEHALVKYLPPDDGPDKKRGQAKKQVAAVQESVAASLDLFGSKDFSEITEEELAEAQRATMQRLIRVGLDPERIIDEEKRKMTSWVIKGSGGKDNLGRINWLIATRALEAANRRAIRRELGIGHIISKFIPMREALKFEREFSREIIFPEAIARCRQMPLHTVFKYPDRQPPGNQLHLVRGILNTTIWQLQQPHVKPYRLVGRKVGEILEIAVDLSEQNRREEIIERNLFSLAKEWLEDTLEQQKDIYPPSA